MSFQVFLTGDAARGPEDLYNYIELHDVPGKAEHVLEQIEKASPACPKILSADHTRRNCRP